jgi:hypothetical protein
MAYGAAYALNTPAVEGYTADRSAVYGVMDRSGGKTETVTYAANSYTLTVHYVYENGTTAAPTATQTLAYSAGGQFSISSPAIEGYTPSAATVTAPAKADRTVTVTYAPNDYTLSVSYRYKDDSQAATPVTRTYKYGETYSVVSPEIEGYTADKAVVAGTIRGDKSETDTYTTGEYMITYSVAGEDPIFVRRGVGEAVEPAADVDTDRTGYTFSGWSWDCGYEPETMPAGDLVATGSFTANKYELTINYVYADNSAARPSKTVSVAYDDTYTETPEALTGYTASPASLSVKMDDVGGKTATVTYAKNSYKLTVSFNSAVAEGTAVSYAIDGGPARTAAVHGGKVEIMVPYQSTCVVTAPSVSGYTASAASVSVTMGAAAESRSITYASTGGSGGGSTTGGSGAKLSDTISTADGTVASANIADALKAGTGRVNITTKTESATIAVADAKKVAECRADLTVSTGAGSVTFAAEGLGGLTDSAASGDSLRVVVDAEAGAGKGFSVVSGNTVLGSAEVSIYLNEKEIREGFGTLIIKIPVGKAYAGQTVSVLHVKGDGGYTVLEAMVDEEGDAAFRVSSLSTFIVLGKKAASVAGLFKDIKSGDWFEGYVQYVYDEGIMKGVTADEFDPNGGASRAMVVTVLWRMAGAKTGNARTGIGKRSTGPLPTA